MKKKTRNFETNIYLNGFPLSLSQKISIREFSQLQTKDKCNHKYWFTVLQIGKGGSEGSPRKKSEWEKDETPLKL